MLRAFIVVNLLVVLSIAALACGDSADPEEARKIAIGAFAEYAGEMQFDPSTFVGPDSASATGADYGFAWKHVDAEGKIVVYVWVLPDRSTEIAVDGTTYRLRQLQDEG